MIDGKPMTVKAPQCVRTLRLKVKTEAHAWLNAAAAEVNQVWTSSEREVAHEIAVRLAFADADEHMPRQPVMFALRGLERGLGAQIVILVRHGRTPFERPGA